MYPRILSVLERKEWNRQSQKERAAVDAELLRVRQILAGLSKGQSPYEERAIQRLQSELQLLETATSQRLPPPARGIARQGHRRWLEPSKHLREALRAGVCGRRWPRGPVRARGEIVGAR